MSGCLNQVTIFGRLGKDPEHRATGNGKSVVTLTIATSETYGQGENKKEKTEWHRVILWEKLADLADKYLAKGRRVLIEGKLTYRQYDDKQNVKHYITEIVGYKLILIDKGEGGAAAGTNPNDGQYPPGYDGTADDDIPFGG